MTSAIRPENYRDMAFLITNTDIVVNAGPAFSVLTGYENVEILSKNIEEIINNSLRSTCRINSPVYVRNELTCFIFTKSLEMRQVIISVHDIENCTNKLYMFKEKNNSRFEDRFSFLNAVFRHNITGVGVYCVSPEIILLKANQAYLDFFDPPCNQKEYSIGKYIDQFIARWTGSTSNAICKKLLSSGGPFHIEECKHKGPVRGIRYFSSTLTPIFEDGIIKYVVETSADVTESVITRKLVQEQAQIILTQKKQLEAIIENMSDSVLTVDKQGNYTYINKSARDLGFTPKNVEECYYWNEFYDFSGNRLSTSQMPSSCIIRGEKFHQRRLIRKSAHIERYLSVSGSPIFDENGDFILGVICISNITAQTKYEKLIEHQRDYLYNIIDTMDLPVMRLEYPILNLIAINKKAFADFYGICGEPGNIKPGDCISNLIPSPYREEIYRYYKEMIKTCGTVYMDNFKIKRGGKDAYYNIILKPVLNADGNIKEIIILGVDVTHEALIKEILENEIKMKDEFLAVISHEFKTPLTVINSAIQAIEFLCKDELSDKAKGFMSKIKQNSYRQLRLVNNLLDITRVKTGHIKINSKNMDIVSLTRSIIESIHLYAEQKDIKLIFSTTLKQKIIGIDDEKYERILLNLLSNAIKFTPQGKSITVKVSSGKGNICIEVKDKGIGIPEDKLEMIFERFGQVDSSLSRQAEGTGIGLSLVKLFVEALGGSISVKSRIGKGSTFTLLLPSAKVKESPKEKSLQELTDNQLIHSTSIEFSDIYLS